MKPFLHFAQIIKKKDSESKATVDKIQEALANHEQKKTKIYLKNFKKKKMQ